MNAIADQIYREARAQLMPMTDEQAARIINERSNAGLLDELVNDNRVLACLAKCDLNQLSTEWERVVNKRLDYLSEQARILQCTMEQL